MLDYSKKLKEKIDKKKAKVCVVGMGYVGLPVAVAFAKKGFLVYGFDTSASRIEKLRKGVDYIIDVPARESLPLIRKKRLTPTIDAKVIRDSDVIIICVPTPLRKVKIPDVSYIISASKTIKKYMRKAQLIVLESTSYPATTREVVLPILKKSGLKEEADFFLCFSPERVNPGDKNYPFVKIPKVVGGLSSRSGKLGAALYSQIIQKVHRVSCPEAAETSKLLENTFRLVNIALANEFALVCHKLKIDIWEVIAAAKTKPFGFMPFYPGPGIGGHCLSGKETVIIRKSRGCMCVKTFKELFEEEEKSCERKAVFKGIEYIRPKALEMLSFDPDKLKPVFKEVKILSRRITFEKLMRLDTNDNRKLTVTDKHPMIVRENGQLVCKWACDLKPGDEIPFVITGISSESQKKKQAIDLIKELKGKQLAAKIRVRPVKESWTRYREQLRKIGVPSDSLRDYMRGNYLPYEYFLLAEKEGVITMDHRRLILCSGRGPSYSRMPAHIEIDEDMQRLIGYYLSEGCVTKDKSLRVRFTFNINETGCIEDLLSILKNKNIPYSTYRARIEKSFHIKVSSNLFGFFLKDILKCGVNSYTMKIPDIMFSVPYKEKRELLKGMFRGEGGVDIAAGKRNHVKNNKQYCHQSNTASVNYFSSSNILFHQLIYTLQSQGIVPIFKKRDGSLLITGHRQLKNFANTFLDEKAKKLKKFFDSRIKDMPNRSYADHRDFATAKVKSLSRVRDSAVYSAEITDTNTFVSSYGIIVHNCIPCDPIYLSWKARKLGFKTKMIDLAAGINRYMPQYVVERVSELLGEHIIPLKKARILILGVAYKNNVKDLRESPALDIIELFSKEGAKVDYYDPLFPYLTIDDIDLKRATITVNALKRYDCVVLVTSHANVNYESIQRNARLILDTRNVYKKKYDNVVRL